MPQISRVVFVTGESDAEWLRYDGPIMSDDDATD